MPIVQKNAEPFFFLGGKTGCLLVHGFTGSPSEMRYLGNYLAKKNFTVFGVQLAGHGTTPEEMAATAWSDWYRSVEQAYIELSERCNKVFIIGLSMGGILSLHASLDYPAAGIVAINAPIYIQDQKIFLAGILQHFVAFSEKKNYQPIDDHFSYQRVPVNCANSLVNLIRLVSKELPQVSAPLLVLQSDKDQTIYPKSADFIFNRSGSNDKELIRYPKSGHMLTIGVEREQVAERILEFIQKHE